MDLPSHTLIDAGTGGVATCEGCAASGDYGPGGEPGYALADTCGFARCRGCCGRSEAHVGRCLTASVVGTVSSDVVVICSVTDEPTDCRY